MKKILFASMMLVAMMATTFTSCSKDDSEPAMVGTWVYSDTNTNTYGSGSYSTTTTWTENLTLVLNEDGTGTLQQNGSTRTSGYNTSSNNSENWNIFYNLIYTYDPEKNDRYGKARFSIVSMTPDEDSHASYSKNQTIDSDFSVAGGKMSVLNRVFTRQ